MAEEKHSKTTLKRERQREALVDVAKATIAEHGLQGLKVRDLAQNVGIALGGVYNLVGDLDELILLVSAQTLADLERKITAALQKEKPATPEAELITIGRAYHHFARENYHLWRTLFDHHPPHDRLPDWVQAVRMRPFHRVEQPLGTLMPGVVQEKVALFAQTLFSSVHGMVSIGLESHDVGVRKDLLDEQIGLLISLIAAGLAAQKAG